MKNKIYFIQAINNKDIESVKCFLKYSTFNPACFNNYALNHSAKNGCLEIVKLLLQDYRIDPSLNNNKALSCAADSNSFEIFKLILKDKRVNPSDNDNYALATSSLNGNLEMVKLLLSDPRSFIQCEEKSIINASKNNHTKVVNILLKDGRADPDAYSGVAIISSVERSRSDIFNLLVDDNRLSTLSLQHSFLAATENGELDMVKKLLLFKDIDLTYEDNIAIKSAYDNQHFDIVQLLGKNDKVKKLLLVDAPYIQKYLNLNKIKESIKSF